MFGCDEANGPGGSDGTKFPATVVDLFSTSLDLTPCRGPSVVGANRREDATDRVGDHEASQQARNRKHRIPKTLFRGVPTTRQIKHLHHHPEHENKPNANLNCSGHPATCRPARRGKDSTEGLRTCVSGSGSRAAQSPPSAPKRVHRPKVDQQNRRLSSTRPRLVQTPCMPGIAPSAGKSREGVSVSRRIAGRRWQAWPAPSKASRHYFFAPFPSHFIVRNRPADRNESFAPPVGRRG